jgi:antirestriction protein ArdC
MNTKTQTKAEATNETRKDVYSIVTDKILAELERGVVPWRKPWASDERFPMNLASGKEYRGINLILLHFAGYASPYWLTFNQINERGGRIRKGEKSTLVTFFKTYLKDKATGKSIKGKPENPENCDSIRVLRYYLVWNVEQCEGIDYPKPEQRSIDFNPIAEAESIIAAMPKLPVITHNESRAYYRTTTDTVNLPKHETFENPQEYYSTAFHELTHATGHASRLNRFSKDETSHAFGSGSYAREELIAELGASFLSARAGILHRTLDNSAAYISSWIKRLKDDRKLIVQAASKANRAADYILGKEIVLS